jgi:ABC-type nitrate/sulfonate/bicarbonate transport system substrate-binding protein
MLKTSGATVRRAAYLLLTGMIISASTACTPGREAPRLPVRIAYTRTYGSALVQIAGAKNFFGDAGLEPQLAAYDVGKDSAQALFDGKADVAVSADTVLVDRILEGQPLVVLASIQRSTKHNGVVARRDRGISTAIDLKGKRIGLTRGTASEYLLHALLVEQNLANSDIVAVDMSTQDLGKALSEGKVDAVATSNPNLERIALELGDVAVRFYQETLFTERFCVFAYKDWAASHKEEIRRLIGALSRAESLLCSREAEAKLIVEKATSTDQAVLDAVWPDSSYPLSIDQSLLVDFEDQARWLGRNECGLLQRGAAARAAPAIPDFLDHIDETALKAVEPAAVQIVR